MTEIVPVTTAGHIAATRELFRQYAVSLDFNLCFQNFEHELASLPGDYAPPRGALYLARVDGVSVGCIGLRPFSGNIGEIKRLYVAPTCRGQGLARSLVLSAITAAKRIGYETLVLDTLASMRPAIALYESFGFTRTVAYYPNPLADALYFRLSLPAPPQ